MTTPGYALFPTAIGVCGLAWSERGITRVVFPERTQAATRARLTRRDQAMTETPPPPAIAEAICAITTLLESGRADLSAIALDMDGVDAQERAILESARTVPPGSTVTYGELAARIGQPRATREVGQAMARNRFPIVVPCHRVLAAGGGFGGFSAPGGLEAKARLLTIVRAATSATPMLFDDLPIAVRPAGSG
jgi:methylated-DNA-[protein]-cysteine S-methyltransferase